MRLGLNLRVTLIVVPLVATTLLLALAPIRSYLRLRSAMTDVRRELGFVLDLCRFDIQAVHQSVEYFGVAFRGTDPRTLEMLEAEGRATLDSLRRRAGSPRRVERLERIDEAYTRLGEVGDRAIELARRGERDEATRLFTETIERLRDEELLPLIDAELIDTRLALRQALDRLLASSAQVLTPPLARVESDANRLRHETALTISIARFARQAQRLLSEYRCFAFLGKSPGELTAAENEFDYAFTMWEVQVKAREPDTHTAPAPVIDDVVDGYRAVKQAIDGLAGLEIDAARGEAVRIYESELEPLAHQSLPRVLTFAFEAHDARISSLLESISMRSRASGTVRAALASLALGLALAFPWLISRWIVRPVLALTRAARELGAAAGGEPVDVPVPAHGRDEIAELAASFHRMAEQLAERTRELEAERARERLYHEERLASVGTLAAGLAHQINNPLNNVLLTAENALGEAGPAAAEAWRDALSACAEEAKRCERIVRGLVAFSRGEAGQKSREDANRLLQRVCELAADTAAERRATIELRLDPRPAPILANVIALEQALVNVLRNALQSRARTVGLGTERRADSVRIAIRDDGRGIDRDELGRLFDPFYTTRHEEGGLGLGLSVAHRIIADHGGEIRFASRRGEGTVVTIDLPLAAPSGDSP